MMALRNQTVQPQRGERIKPRAQALGRNVSEAKHRRCERTMPGSYLLATPSRSLTTAAEIPTTRMTLFRLVSPAAIITADRGTRSTSEKNSTQAAFAFPSTGGAVNATFNASPNSPTIAFRFARGWTLIANVTPAAVSLIEITSYMISRSEPLALSFWLLA